MQKSLPRLRAGFRLIQHGGLAYSLAYGVARTSFSAIADYRLMRTRRDVADVPVPFRGRRFRSARVLHSVRTAWSQANEQTACNG